LASELRAEVDTVPRIPSNPMTEAAVEQEFLRFVGHLPEAPTLARAILRGPLHCVMPL
jgi:hypothetical protein